MDLPPYQPVPVAPQKKFPFLTCGIIAAVVLCLGVAGVTILAVLGVFSSPVEASLTVDVTAPPPVAIGEKFDVTVTLKNQGKSEMRVDRISLPAALLDAAELLSVEPAYSAENAANDKTDYTVDLAVPAQNTYRVVFHFRAARQGDYVGEVGAGSGGSSATAQVRVLVTAAQTGQTGQTAVPPRPTPTTSPTSAPSSLGAIPFEAVVQIYAIVDVNGEVQDGWTGSGSIISNTGLILTNAHVVLSDRYYTVQQLQIGITTAADNPPDRRFIAIPLQVDKDLDIAVLRIESDLDGNPVNPADLNLPVVPLGNSDTLGLGDPIVIIGYPGIGGQTVTLTRGEVSGFTSEGGYGNRAFIKTSATIAGGNSGGMAANSTGQLIGVPTQLGYGGDDQYIDCRVLADTNRDGVIDDRDSCVPTGGFINSLRPLKLALPLIEAAGRGEVNINPGSQPGGESLPSGSTIVFQDDFSDTNSGWGDGSDAETAYGYTNGEYFLQVKEVNYLAWNYTADQYRDMIATIEARVTEATGIGEYGLMCRYVDADNFYALEISEDGYAAIYKYVNGEFTSLYDWEYSDLIPTDGSRVVISAACIGDQLTLAVNDRVVAKATDASLSKGNAGFIAGTYEQPNLTVHFDNFTIYRP